MLGSWKTDFIPHYPIAFRREEEREEAGDVEDPESSAGTRKSDLVGWYLGEIQEDIESEEELVEKKVMVEKIIDRLVNQDQVRIFFIMRPRITA